MNKRVFIILSIILNTIILALDGLAIIQSLIQWMPKEEDKILWYQAFTYYTEDSNIALFIGALFTLISNILLLKNKNSKRVYSILKFLGTTVTMVTFVTVYLFMIVLKDPSLGFSVTGNLWLIVHTICPLLGLISYVIFDPSNDIRLKEILIPISFTIGYTILILLTYAFGGRIPYVTDFDNEYVVNGWFILFLGALETSLTLILALVIRYIKNLCNKGRRS